MGILEDAGVGGPYGSEDGADTIIAAGQSVMGEGKKFAQKCYDAIREEGLRIRRVYSRVSILMSCQRESAIAAA